MSPGSVQHKHVTPSGKQKTQHFILTGSPLLFRFLSWACWHIPCHAHSPKGAYQLGSTKPLYPRKGGIDKPNGIRWDRFLVLSGISVVRFSKHLWRGLPSHTWTTVFHDLLANPQLFHADGRLLSTIDSLQQRSRIHHTTRYCVQASEGSPQALTGLALKAI